MKRRMMYLFLALALIFTMFPIAAMAAGDDWSYSNNGDGTATITGYTGSEENVVTPKKLGGLDVTVIGAGAFADNKVITSIIISEGVTEIKEGAFQNCSELSIIHIPRSTTIISTEDTFANVDGLWRVYVYNEAVIYTPSDTNMFEGMHVEMISSYASTTRTYAESHSINFMAPWIWFDGDAFTRLESGEVYQLNAMSEPNGCLISWSSSNESVATVSNDGLVTAGGTVGLSVITASCMGMEAVFFVTVTGDIKTYTDGNGDEWDYYENGDGTVTIYRYNNNERTDVTTPNVIASMPVTAISSYAFRDKVNIHDVKISEGVTRIGDTHYTEDLILCEVFLGCTGLSNVILPSTLESIGFNTFYKSSVDSIQFTTSPEDDTLISCNDIFWVEGDAEHPYVLFSEKEPDYIKLELYFDKNQSINSYRIPDNVMYLGSRSFSGNNTLTSIIIPETVRQLEWSIIEMNKLETVTFQGERELIDGCINCPKLATINWPTGLKYIGWSAFAGCGFTSIEIPSSVVDFSGWVFSECRDLTSVTFAPDSQLSWIGEGSFSQSGLQSINIPSLVEGFGNWVFSQCADLTSVTFADGSSLKGMGDYAFGESGLQSIEIPSQVEWIGFNAFRECRNLTSVTFAPDSQLSWISDGSYYNSGLQSIEIPSLVEGIGNDAFAKCNDLTSVTFAAGSQLERIGDNAFSESGLQNIVFPSSLRFIEFGAFSECADLTTAALNDGLYIINRYAFSRTGLKSITIPASVDYIGEWAFSGCSELETIKVSPDNHFYKNADNDPDGHVLYQVCYNEEHEPVGMDLLMFPGGWHPGSFSVPDYVFGIHNGAFKDAGLNSITLPNELLFWIGGEETFAGNNFSRIDIPASVETIGGSYTFANNSNLAQLVVYGNDTEFEWVDGEPTFENTPNVRLYANSNSKAKVFAADHDIPFSIIPIDITLNKTTATLKKGDTLTLAATTDPVGGYVTWSSSDNSIASVDLAGKVTAKAVGNATITATCLDETATCQVSVEQTSFSIAVSANNASYGSVTGGGTYDNGASATVKATPKSGYRFVRWLEDGTEVSKNASYTFAVTKNVTLIAEFASDSSVVSFSANNASYGSVTGGRSYINGTSAALTAVPSQGYRFIGWTEGGTQVSTNANYSFVVTQGRTLIAQFTALTPVDINCSKIDATVYGGTNGTVTISASGGDSSVYEYSINGGASWQSSNTFSGLGAGTYTAAVRDAVYPSNVATCSVSVRQPTHLGSVAAKKILSRANAGTAVTVVPPAPPKGYTIVSVTYLSTKPSVASVDASGNVTFLAGGKTTIVTKIVSQMTDKSGKLKTKTTTIKKAITVKQPIATVTLNLNSATIARKNKLKLAPSIYPSTASSKKLKWTSSNSKVASVSSAGVVTGKAGGTAVITCKATDGSGASAACIVTVTPIYPTSIKLSKAAITIKVGKKASLKASVQPSSTDFKMVTWTSSNPAVATVDAKGKVKAVASGTCVITASTSTGLLASCTVTVQ